jgi:4-hydroxy-2-oxoheptanedioate aldolase
MVKNFKEQILSNKTMVGTWSIIPSLDIYDIISMTKFDFLIADMEHGPFNIETIHQFVSFLESKDITPIVRVPKLDESYILRILETGISAIQVSHISNREEALRFVQYSKYPPIGIRGLSPVSRAAKYDYTGEMTHTINQNDKLTLILNIEGKDGIDNLDEIASLSGVDIIFLGIYDISQFVGTPGNIYHPDVKEIIESATEIILKHGKTAGCFAKTIEDIIYFQELGIKYITYQADAPIIRDTFFSIANTIKDSLK